VQQQILRFAQDDNIAAQRDGTAAQRDSITA
jgi:hypothetical protein